MNQKHHWMDWDAHEREDEDGEIVLGDVIVECMHCDATKPWDPDEDDFDDVDDDESEQHVDALTLPLFKDG